MDFNSLKQSCYRKVAQDPFSPTVTVLVGSDTVLHLPVLEWFASLCDSVVEFGVRTGESTVALISGCKGEVKSYDIVESEAVGLLRSLVLPCSWTFRRHDTLTHSHLVPEADLFFFDTLHTYDHLKKELDLHGRKARKFLVFHDVFTCGQQDISGPDPSVRGIMPAIEEFVARFPDEYETAYKTDCNNGLLVLRRLS